MIPRIRRNDSVPLPLILEAAYDGNLDKIKFLVSQGHSVEQVDSVSQVNHKSTI
jgi:hypothetical protein